MINSKQLDLMSMQVAYEADQAQLTDISLSLNTSPSPLDS